jgi:hypothetical protein
MLASGELEGRRAGSAWRVALAGVGRLREAQTGAAGPARRPQRLSRPVVPARPGALCRGRLRAPPAALTSPYACG